MRGKHAFHPHLIDDKNGKEGPGTISRGLLHVQLSIKP